MARNLIELLLGGRVNWHRVGMDAGAPWQDDPARWGPPLDPTHYARLGLDDAVMPGELSLALQQLESDTKARAHPLPPDVALAVEVLSDPLRKNAYDAYLRRERRRVHQQQENRQRKQMLLWGGAAALGLAVILIWWI